MNWCHLICSTCLWHFTCKASRAVESTERRVQVSLAYNNTDIKLGHLKTGLTRKKTNKAHVLGSFEPILDRWLLLCVAVQRASCRTVSSTAVPVVQQAASSAVWTVRRWRSSWLCRRRSAVPPVWLRWPAPPRESKSTPGKCSSVACRLTSMKVYFYREALVNAPPTLVIYWRPGVCLYKWQISPDYNNYICTETNRY